MNESVANTWVTIVLILLFLIPFLGISLWQRLFKQYSFSLFIKVVNRTALIYLLILFFMVLFVMGNYPLIDDPEYPDPNEILAGGITFGFGFLFICIFLPAILIFNLVNNFTKAG